MGEPTDDDAELCSSYSLLDLEHSRGSPEEKKNLKQAEGLTEKVEEEENDLSRIQV